MTDIVERLRENILADAFKDKVIISGKLTERLMYERRDAAAEITRLRLIAYQPADKHDIGCDCIQCVPF